MQSGARYLVILGTLLLSEQVCAQIYTCVAPDGTRIFSDERMRPRRKGREGNHESQTHSCDAGGGTSTENFSRTGTVAEVVQQRR